MPFKGPEWDAVKAHVKSEMFNASGEALREAFQTRPEDRLRLVKTFWHNNGNGTETFAKQYADGTVSFGCTTRKIEYIGGESPQDVALDIIKDGLARFQREGYAGIPTGWVDTAFAMWYTAFNVAFRMTGMGYTDAQLNAHCQSVWDEIRKLGYQITHSLT